MQEPVNASPTRATLRANWIAALRSGKYKQCKGKLKVGDSYCCLGVACEVLGIVPIQIDNEWLYESEVAELPTLAFEALGLRDDEVCQRLIIMNDTDGKSFHQIADALENGDYFDRESEEVD